MKSFLLIASIIISVSFSRIASINFPMAAVAADTGHINHVLDGLVNEWPAGKFQTNEDSTIEFAADNDDKNLYVALSIPDFDMQVKIMRNGMKLFTDPKGKRKEGKGIEFPIKGEAGSFYNSSNAAAGNNGPEDAQKKKFDRKSIRNVMSLGLTALKLFGLDNNGEDEQGLLMPGSVNVAYKWDSADVMHIEYYIPLHLLGETSSLNQKEISIGWKINAFERVQRPNEEQSAGNEENEGRGFSRGMGGGRGQYGGARGYGGGRGGSRRFDPEEMRKEQSFWTKYMITLQPSQKAF